MDDLKTDLVISKNRWKLLERLCIKNRLIGVKYSLNIDYQYAKLFLPFFYYFFNRTTPLNMKKVTGLGGVFFKCDNPQGMNEWYARVNHSSHNDYMAIAMGLKPTVLKIYYYAH